MSFSEKPFSERLRESSKVLRYLVRAWADEVKSAGVSDRKIEKLTRAACGEGILSSAFLSENKKLKNLTKTASFEKMAVIAETNRFLEKIQSGQQDQPIDPDWLRVPTLKINGETADEVALMQVASGHLYPSEVQRWVIDINDPDLNFEEGLRRYLSALDVTVDRLMTAYAPNNQAAQGRMALVLIGRAKFEGLQREQEVQAIANALTQILGREVTPDQVSIGITSMA